MVETVLLRKTLSDKEFQQFMSYRSKLTKLYNSLNEVERELLKDYYEKNIDFIESILKGNTHIDKFICLESVKASIDYLKVFAKDKD
jgi:hypothetical protein